VNTGIVLHGQSLVWGTARGSVSVLTAPLSLWGGFDLESGQISDVNHPQYGTEIAGKILVMPGGRGSSSSSSILLESARLSVNPRAIIMTEKDPIIVIGALVAADLYKVQIPVILIEPDGLDRFSSGMKVKVDATSSKASMTTVMETQFP
jgi:predicted aconitase with swiveling domain